MPITVVVPIWNTPPEYLHACLDSLLAQTVRPDHILLIDDGSTDPNTIEAFHSREEEFKIHRKEHSGLSHTMNIAIGLCETDYLLKFDSDDIAERTLIESTKYKLKQFPDAAVIGCQIEAFGSTSYRTKHPVLVTADLLLQSEYYWSVNHPGCAFKLAALKAVGGYALERDGLSEDYELFVNILCAGGVIRNNRDVLVKYRVHPGTLRSVNETERNRKFVERCREKLLWARAERGPGEPTK